MILYAQTTPEHRLGRASAKAPSETANILLTLFRDVAPHDEPNQYF
jgi:hypothetical protein